MLLPEAAQEFVPMGNACQLASPFASDVSTDTQLLKHANGIGWANIYSRIDYLDGKVDIHSEPKNGTSVNIEIKI